MNLEREGGLGELKRTRKSLINIPRHTVSGYWRGDEFEYEFGTEEKRENLKKTEETFNLEESTMSNARNKISKIASKM